MSAEKIENSEQEISCFLTEERGELFTRSTVNQPSLPSKKKREKKRERKKWNNNISAFSHRFGKKILFREKGVGSFVRRTKNERREIKKRKRERERNKKDR